MSPYYSSEDGRPDLRAIIAPRPLMATSANTSPRRSPRKKTGVTTHVHPSPQKRQRGVPGPAKAAPLTSIPPPTKSRPPANSSKPVKANPSILDGVLRLPRNTSTTETTLTSNNRRSPAGTQRSLKLVHVDSMLLSPKGRVTEEERMETNIPRPVSKPDRFRRAEDSGMSIMSLMTEAARTSSTKVNGALRKETSSYASRFVLNEACCNDDEASMDEDYEEEDTDLSGFIVDDDAELSYHDSSPSDDDGDDRRMSTKTPPKTAPRRRLRRGSPTRRRLSFLDEESGSNNENHGARALSNAMQGLRLGETNLRGTKPETEVIDLTSSPALAPQIELNLRPDACSTQAQPASPTKKSSHDSNPFRDSGSILKFSPPSSRPSLLVPSKDMSAQDRITIDDDDGQDRLSRETDTRFKTPPTTPPQSPSKLKSPSKLLSPSKRQTIPQSPHRQSMDAFWDHNVVNEWNDEFSPKKAPATSPRKRGLARFQIWSDSEEDEEDKTFGNSDSLPSPCSSPRKSRSPIKSPEKEEKRRLAEEKRAATARKKAFDAQKERLALDLLHELDEKVADSQLEKLASSSDGVQIIWSKTLRSTAGRANWKRTVTKPAGSPIKGIPDPGACVKIQHYASIELAEKIIDCEDRLVNTLAHEFCHLTNFMISNVRDQPHGASFKKWAAKVTSHLRQSDVESWRNVHVTTKHSYVINHKYLWACVGREKTSAMEYLNVDEDEGCGAEYGRHSKSIDTEKHRCGRCKGRLVQVRPKPRASPAKKSGIGKRGLSRDVSGSSSSSSGSSSTTGNPLRRMIETIELSD